MVMTWRRAYRKAGIMVTARASGTLEGTPSDLLVPAALWGFACSLRRKHGEWRDVVNYLLNTHRTRVLAGAHQLTHRRFHYQQCGLSLRRVSYVPYSSAYVQLRMLSFAARVSMCALFTQMLLWELDDKPPPAELTNFRGVPIEFETRWLWGPGTLEIFAHIQMPAQRDGPG